MSRGMKIAITLICLAVVGGLVVARETLGPPSIEPRIAGVEAGKGRAPRFSHVVVVVFENQEYPTIIGNPAAPTFNELARRYALLTRSYAVTHPSLPNYLALVSGSTQGLTDNCEDCVIDAPSLVDSLEQARRGWKTYAEGLPAPGFREYLADRYAKKHNPFLYFKSVLDDPGRLARVVPYSDLAADLERGQLPQFALVVPDLCNSMHDCSVETGDVWLKSLADRLLGSPQMDGGVIFITFDEGTSNVRGGGRIPTIVAGPTVIPGVRSAQPATHYSVLRTIQDAWGLPLLGESAKAQPILGIWREG